MCYMGAHWRNLANTTYDWTVHIRVGRIMRRRDAALRQITLTMRHLAGVSFRPSYFRKEGRLNKAECVQTKGVLLSPMPGSSSQCSHSVHAARRCCVIFAAICVAIRDTVSGLNVTSATRHIARQHTVPRGDIKVTFTVQQHERCFKKCALLM